MKFAGIDWATDIHYVALLDGMEAEEWKVAHEPAAVKDLLARFERAGGPKEVWVAIESGAPLVTDQLIEAGYRVYPINPKQADRFRDRFSVAGAKDDRRDALMLAHALRTDADRLRALDPESPLTEELRLRDRARTRLVTQRTRESNQLRQVISRYYPALLRLDRGVHTAFFLALLRAYPDPERGRSALTPRLQRLRALFEKHPDRDLLQSLPGLGVCLAARVSAELGDHRAHDGDPAAFRPSRGPHR